MGSYHSPSLTFNTLHFSRKASAFMVFYGYLIRLNISPGWSAGDVNKDISSSGRFWHLCSLNTVCLPGCFSQSFSSVEFQHALYLPRTTELVLISYVALILLALCASCTVLLITSIKTLIKNYGLDEEILVGTKVFRYTDSFYFFGRLKQFESTVKLRRMLYAYVTVLISILKPYRNETVRASKDE